MVDVWWEGAREIEIIRNNNKNIKIKKNSSKTLTQRGGHSGSNEMKQIVAKIRTQAKERRKRKWIKKSKQNNIDYNNNNNDDTNNDYVLHPHLTSSERSAGKRGSKAMRPRSVMNALFDTSGANLFSVNTKTGYELKTERNYE